jgi:hypothetical protein
MVIMVQENITGRIVTCVRESVFSVWGSSFLKNHAVMQIVQRGPRLNSFCLPVTSIGKS